MLSFHDKIELCLLYYPADVLILLLYASSLRPTSHSTFDILTFTPFIKCRTVLQSRAESGIFSGYRGSDLLQGSLQNMLKHLLTKLKFCLILFYLGIF